MGVARVGRGRGLARARVGAGVIGARGHLSSASWRVLYEPVESVHRRSSSSSSRHSPARPVGRTTYLHSMSGAEELRGSPAGARR